MDTVACKAVGAGAADIATSKALILATESTIFWILQVCKARHYKHMNRGEQPLRDSLGSRG